MPSAMLSSQQFLDNMPDRIIFVIRDSTFLVVASPFVTTRIYALLTFNGLITQLA